MPKTKLSRLRDMRSAIARDAFRMATHLKYIGLWFVALGVAWGITRVTSFAIPTGAMAVVAYASYTLLIIGFVLMIFIYFAPMVLRLLDHMIYKEHIKVDRLNRLTPLQQHQEIKRAIARLTKTADEAVKGFFGCLIVMVLALVIAGWLEVQFDSFSLDHSGKLWMIFMFGIAVLGIMATGFAVKMAIFNVKIRRKETQLNERK